MNNRKWLETLSDTSTPNWNDAHKEFATKMRKTFEQGGALVDGDIILMLACYTDWLQAEHTTTADEDFAEINFFLNNFKEFGRPSEVISYGCGHDAYMVAIFKDGNNVYSADTGLRWTDNQIDQIRTIADKKRKEMGW